MLATKDINAARSLLTIVAAPLHRDSHPALENDEGQSLDGSRSFDEAMARVLTGGADESAATEPVECKREKGLSQCSETSTGGSELVGALACCASQQAGQMLQSPVETPATVAEGEQANPELKSAPADPALGPLWAEPSAVVSRAATEPRRAPATRDTPADGATADAGIRVPPVSNPQGHSSTANVLPDPSSGPVVSEGKADASASADTPTVHLTVPPSSLDSQTMSRVSGSSGQHGEEIHLPTPRGPEPCLDSEPSALAQSPGSTADSGNEGRQSPAGLIPEPARTESATLPGAQGSFRGAPRRDPETAQASSTANLPTPQSTDVLVDSGRPAASMPAAPASPAMGATGTSTAKNSSRLKKLEDMGLPSRNAGRTLPGAATLSAASADPARPKPAGPAPPTSHEPSSAAWAAPTPPFPSSSQTVASPRTEGVASETPVMNLRPLEHRIVSVAAEVRRLKPDSMSVVLKPDAQTELHLQLQLHQGRVDVEAKVQRGDLGAFRAEWAHLQQTLALQGIRLGDLQPASSLPPTGLGSGGGSPPQHRERPAQQPPGDLSHEPAPPRLTGAAKSKPGPKLGRRSWESWA